MVHQVDPRRACYRCLRGPISRAGKIFARSLAVLREFLSAYQKKPQFATPKPKPLVMAASDNVEGEP